MTCFWSLYLASPLSFTFVHLLNTKAYKRHIQHLRTMCGATAPAAAPPSVCVRCTSALHLNDYYDITAWRMVVALGCCVSLFLAASLSTCVSFSASLHFVIISISLVVVVFSVQNKIILLLFAFAYYTHLFWFEHDFFFVICNGSRIRISLFLCAFSYANGFRIAAVFR